MHGNKQGTNAGLNNEHFRFSKKAWDKKKDTKDK